MNQAQAATAAASPGTFSHVPPGVRNGIGDYIRAYLNHASNWSNYAGSNGSEGYNGTFKDITKSFFGSKQLKGIGVLIAAHLAQQGTSSVITALARTRLKAKHRSNVHGIYTYESKLPDHYNRYAPKWLKKRVKITDSYLFHEGGRTWHCHTMAVTFSNGLVRQLSVLSMLAVPNKAYYFDRELSQEDAVTLTLGRRVGYPEQIPGFIGDTNELDLIIPLLRLIKWIIYLIDWLVIDPEERDGHNPGVSDYRAYGDSGGPWGGGGGPDGGPRPRRTTYRNAWRHPNGAAETTYQPHSYGPGTGQAGSATAAQPYPSTRYRPYAASPSGAPTYGGTYSHNTPQQPFPYGGYGQPPAGNLYGAQQSPQIWAYPGTPQQNYGPGPIAPGSIIQAANGAPIILENHAITLVNVMGNNNYSDYETNPAYSYIALYPTGQLTGLAITPVTEEVEGYVSEDLSAFTIIHTESGQCVNAVYTQTGALTPVYLDSVEQAAHLCSLLATLNWNVPPDYLTEEMITRGCQIVFQFMQTHGKLPQNAVPPMVY